MESWDGCEWLHSSVVLNKGVCYLILASLKTITWPNASLHLSLLKFKMTILPASGPLPPAHVRTCLIQSTPSKKLSKMVGNLPA